MDKRYIRIVSALFLLIAFFYITATRLDPDLGWHLRLGQEILQTGEAPRFDTFSHTMPGHEWVDHEWAADAGLAFLEIQNLWWIAVVFFTLITALPFLIWLWRARLLSQQFFVVLAALLMLNHIGVRPQMLSFFFLFLLFESLRSKEKTFWLMPVLFFAWANLHAGFFLGLGILSLFVLASYRKVSGWIVLAASFAATLATPYGWDIYGEIATVLSSSDTSRFIAEWQSAFVHPALKDSFFLSVMLFSALIFFGAVFLWCAWHYWKMYSLPVVVTATLLFLGYTKSLRLGPLFFLAALPVLLEGMDAVKKEIEKKRAGVAYSIAELKIGRAMLFAAPCFLALFVVVLLVAKPQSNYPVRAVEFLRSEFSTEQIGNLLNDYAWGGYLIRNLPEVKVFIDGRMPHWVDESGYSAMAEYAEVFYPPEGQESRFAEVVDQRKIRTVIIRSVDCKSAEFSTAPKTLTYLHKLGQIPCEITTGLAGMGWKVVYRDEIALILHKM